MCHLNLSILAAITVLFAFTSHCSADPCQYQANTEYEGDQMGTFLTGDAFQCCGVCIANPPCIAAFQRGGNCYMMRSLGASKVVAGSTTVFPGGIIPSPSPSIGPPSPPSPPPPSTWSPLSTISPSSLGYLSTTRIGDAAPNINLLCSGASSFPIGTNAWWVPAILPPTTSGKSVVTQLPYTVYFSSNSLDVAYPNVMGYQNQVLSTVSRTWSLTAVNAPSSYCLKSTDDLTARFQWRCGASPCIDVTLARGSPYIGATFANSAPMFTTTQAIWSFSVDGQTSPCASNEYVGHEFGVQFRNSDEEWLIWLPLNTRIICVANDNSFTLKVVDTGFNGIVRIALANNCTTGRDSISPHCNKPGVPNDVEEYRIALKGGHNACVYGGSANIATSPAASMEYYFRWEVSKCWDSFPTGELLHMALPHHMSMLKGSGAVRVVPNGGHRNLRGYNIPIVSPTSRWDMTLAKDDTPWVGTPDPKYLDALKQAMSQDSSWDLPADAARGVFDIYNAAKLFAKLARLALIAEAIGDMPAALSLAGRLSSRLPVWINHMSQNLLVYDRSWGGIVSCGCNYQNPGSREKAFCANNATQFICPSLQDHNADFGNGFFNDHHYHYGYFIYASAVAAKFDSAWGSKWKEQVLVLVRDIANPSAQDTSFPTFRHFDWYVGHSWASGTVANPVGKNQESTSEAVNAWYGVFLFGKTTNNVAAANLGQSLLLMELHSSRTYWHVSKTDLKHYVYPSTYEHRAIGILHESVAEFQTFFGGKSFFIFGIQVIPLTPVTPLLWKPITWVREAFSEFEPGCLGDQVCTGPCGFQGDTGSGFVIFLIGVQALFDVGGAWARALTVPETMYSTDCSGGNGNSRSNTLFFVASWGNQNSSSYF